MAKKSCKKDTVRWVKGGRCVCKRPDGSSTFISAAACRRKYNIKSSFTRRAKKNCVPGSARYVKGGGCLCSTKGGGAKFIDKYVCERKYKK